MHDVITKKMYHLDEYVLSSFCVNTVKANGKEHDKFVLFKDHLNSFHFKEELYESSLNEYIAFITYTVILDSLKTDKNILTYEPYIYNVLNGFAKNKTGHVMPAKNIARVWMNLVEIFESLVALSKDPLLKSIKINKEVYITRIHYGTKKVNNNYYFNIPIILEYESKTDIVLIQPLRGSVYVNSEFYGSIQYFGRELKNIYVIGISLTKVQYETVTIPITPSVFSKANAFIKTQYLDFNRPSIQNCNLCPLSCGLRDILFHTYLPEPYNPKIKAVKIVPK